jgi:hypothetical protein
MKGFKEYYNEVKGLDESNDNLNWQGKLDADGGDILCHGTYNGINATAYLDLYIGGGDYGFDAVIFAGTLSMEQVGNYSFAKNRIWAKSKVVDNSNQADEFEDKYGELFQSPSPAEAWSIIGGPKMGAPQSDVNIIDDETYASQLKYAVTFLKNNKIPVIRADEGDSKDEPRIYITDDINVQIGHEYYVINDNNGKRQYCNSLNQVVRKLKSIVRK